MNSVLAVAVIALLGLATVQACYYGNCNSGCYQCGYQQPNNFQYRPQSYFGGGGSSSSSAAASSSSSNYGWGGGSSSSSASSSSSSGGGGWGHGFYYDVSVGDASAIKDKQSACAAFMELSTDKQVSGKDLGTFIQDKFYKTKEQQKENNNGLKPATFHCCMKDFGNKIYKGNEQYKAPVLPKDATCDKLEEALFKDLTAKKE